MNAIVWTSARAVRIHRASLAGTAVVVALTAALLTTTGAWIAAGVRDASGPTGSTLLAVASSFAGTAVMIAVLVVASTVTAAMRPRAREFAVMRAVGATAGQVRKLVTTEVALVFAAAAPLGLVAGLLLAPRLTGTLAAAGVVPGDFVLRLSPWPLLATLVLLVPAALAAGRLSARESARRPAVGAMRASAAESSEVSPGRLRAAASLALAGLVVPAVPFVLPGTFGAAGASLAAFLLIIAAALVGPVLLAWLARHGLKWTRSGAVTTLALVNARGFSRRLTGAVIPLALLLAVGTVQTGATVATADAAARQVREAVSADLVVQAPRGSFDAGQVAAVTALAGVTSTATTAMVPAMVRIDQSDEGIPFLGELSWEASALRTVPAQGGFLAPKVVAGSLGALSGDHTIAVSRDAAAGSAGLGDAVDVRVGGNESRYVIVALYERSLGLGDYLVGEHAVAADAGEALLLVRTDREKADMRAAIAATGLTASDVAEYARHVRDGAAAQQTLSVVLLLALLALVAAMAANTLAMVTRSRGPELDLLRRAGATRRQLLGMVLVEASLATGAALLVGVACAVPALLGIGQRLLGVPLPVLDPRVFAGLIVLVVLIGITAPLVTALGTLRRR